MIARRQSWDKPLPDSTSGLSAARLHVVADLREEGWREGRERIPADEAGYRGMGLF
jgi:hypothetical protein